MAINVTINEGDGEAVSVDVATGFVAHTHTYSDLVGLGEDIQDVIGIMISDNTENGIAITYDDETGKLNFDVNDPLITFTGDVTGSGTITNLGNTSFEMTVTDNSHNHLASNVTDFTEATQDVIGEMVTGNTENGLSVTYDDETGKLNFDVADPTISISGDATGSATMTNLGNTTIEIDLSNTGVVANTYGDANSVGQFAVDEDGRITSASNVDINIPSTQVSDFTEASQDAAAALINHSDHTNLTVSYDDDNNKITLVAAGNVLSVNTFTGDVVLDTDDIDEGTSNLYFTDDRAKDSAGDLIANATKTGLSATYAPLTNSLTLTNDGVLSIAGVSGQIDVIDNADGSFDIGLSYEMVAPNNLTVTGNLTVLGETTTLNTSTLNVEDNEIILNSGLDELSNPFSGQSGITVNRGSGTPVSLVYDELQDSWVAFNSTGQQSIVGNVQTVNTLSGDVVLTTQEILENQSLYFTELRAKNAVGPMLDASSNDRITFTYTPGVEGVSNEALNISVNNVPQQVIMVKNTTLVDIPFGTAVYISGHTEGEIVPNIGLANWNTEANMPAIGVTREQILSGSYGYVVVQGPVPFDSRLYDPVTETFTQLYAVGDVVYVGGLGDFVNENELFYDKVVQKIGVVTRLSTDLLEGELLVFNNSNSFSPPAIQDGYIYVGNDSSSAPVKFDMINIDVTGTPTLSLPEATSVDNGKLLWDSTSAEWKVNRNGIWTPLTFLGHTHESLDILDFNDSVENWVDSFLLQLTAGGGLVYTYDKLTDTGNLGARDIDLVFSVSGDVEGETPTITWTDLSDLLVDIPVTFNRLIFSQYIFDSMDHERHSNITVAFDPEPEDASLPQIILNAPTPYTQEELQDFVAPLINHSNHTNVIATYDDNANQIRLDVPDSVDLIQFGDRPAVNGNVTVGLIDITSALGYTPISNTDAETVTDLLAPAIVHDNNVNIIATYDDDNDRIVLEAQNAGAASVGSLTNSWWLGA